MPVEAGDLDRAAADYALTLRRECYSPAVLDLVPDGHTDSLVPGDPVLTMCDKDVAVTGPYQGRRRMTLTYPSINRARQVQWVVTGAEKCKCCMDYFIATQTFHRATSAARSRLCWRMSRRLDGAKGKLKCAWEYILVHGRARGRSARHTISGRRVSCRQLHRRGTADTRAWKKWLRSRPLREPRNKFDFKPSLVVEVAKELQGRR